jgi:hypothetical protein
VHLNGSLASWPRRSWAGLPLPSAPFTVFTPPHVSEVPRSRTFFSPGNRLTVATTVRPDAHWASLGHLPQSCRACLASIVSNHSGALPPFRTRAPGKLHSRLRPPTPPLPPQTRLGVGDSAVALGAAPVARSHAREGPQTALFCPALATFNTLTRPWPGMEAVLPRTTRPGPEGRFSADRGPGLLWPAEASGSRQHPCRNL